MSGRVAETDGDGVRAVMIWPGVSRNRRWMVSGVGRVAREPGAEGGGERLGEHGEHHVQVDVQVDGAREGVGANAR